MSTSVLTIGPSGGAHRYSSLRATSRALSGDGSDSLRRTIARRVSTGGGYVGGTWVECSNIPLVPKKG